MADDGGLLRDDFGFMGFDVVEAMVCLIGYHAHPGVRAVTGQLSSHGAYRC